MTNEKLEELQVLTKKIQTTKDTLSRISKLVKCKDLYISDYGGQIKRIHVPGHLNEVILSLVESSLQKENNKREERFREE